MQFITSLTLEASLLKKLISLWDDGGDPRDPFAAVLVTPLFASPSTLNHIQYELKEKRGAVVYFDSGGYYVQQGKISFTDLYCGLRDFYKDPKNQWADWYVLPDNAPTSSDSPDLVDTKVNDTVTASRMFYAEMPVGIQKRAMAVIQGHTFDQINKCIRLYRDLGVGYLGFGSFGTGGSNNSINIVDSRSARNLAHISEELGNDDIKLHTFGVSTPPVIYAFKKMGIYSFDSLGWQRSAGYGKVYMPYIRAYNVSHRSTRNSAFSRDEFELLKHQTGHSCPFCAVFQELSEKRLYRSLHNLTALMETAGPSKLDKQEIADLLRWKSKRYYKLFEEIYLGP
jgi:hypothetical protein